MENNYDAIFLQETNYTAGKPLAYFKYWKTKMFTNFQNKAMGFGVGTLVSSAQKNVFREDLSHKDLEIIWNEMQMQGEKTLVGNIYIPPGNENHLHILDMELEKHKFENILLTGGISIAETKYGTEALTMIAECVSYLKILLIDMAFT